MIITKERTRLLFTEYNHSEYIYLENLVASMDNVFMYVDQDKNMIGLPTGMEATVRKIFPKAEFIDNSKEYWPYAKIAKVEHNAQPRNQLQKDFIKFVLDNAKHNQKLAGILSPGTGKGSPISTKIPTPTGWKYLGDLKEGDIIFGSNGKRNTVTGIYDKGEEDVYKITFNDGRYALCDEDHLWPIARKWSSSITVMSTKEMINTYKQYDSNKEKTGRDPYRYIYRVPLLSSPVEYEHKDVPIHPYVIGAFIGNGCHTLPILTISSGDDFVPKKIARLTGFEVKFSKSNNFNYVFYHQVDGKLQPVHTKDFFKELPEMMNYSRDIYIPDMYIYNDLEIRMELLRGLMDTDGSISNGSRFNVSYTSCSEKLLKQIQYIIKGLGYIANIGSPDKRSDKYTNGFCASVNIRVPNTFKKQLFTHPKKFKIALYAYERIDVQQPFTHLIIKDIKKIGRDKCRCIKVSAEDELYLTEDFIVTHNTFMACYSAIEVGYRTLIIVPTSSIKRQWAETLTGMFNVPEERVKMVMRPSDFINVKADFVVVSQASLAVLNKKYDLERIMKDNRFGIKVIDEVQMWFKNIINVDANSNIANNWYLTGTFGRSSTTENRLYQEMFGDLAIFREKEKAPSIFNRKPGNIYGMKPYIHINMVWMHSGLSKEEIKKCTSSMRYIERENKWARFGISVPIYLEMVIPSDGRMTKYLRTVLNIVKMANKQVPDGKMLILTSTIASSNVIYDYVKEMFPDKTVNTYNSSIPVNERESLKNNSEILISTISSAGTGFDLKGLRKLITVSPYSSWILSDQVSGRLRRNKDKNGNDIECYMWDIVDADIKQLRIWGNNRADVFKRKSKVFKVIDM